MGRYAMRSIQHFVTVDQIVIADIDYPTARTFADDLNQKASPLQLDVNDSQAMKSAMVGVDIVVNTCGPYFRFALPILRASIDSGCHYLDICDDWEPTIEMLKLDEKAKAADVSATIGLGASPGLTNMMALIAARELDSVVGIVTGWDMSGITLDETGANQSTNAAMLHGVEQMTGKVKIFTEGGFTLVKPLQARNVNYPGIAPFIGNVFGHPEALTFPKYFAGLKESINLAHGGDANSKLLKLVMGLVNLRILSKRKASNLLGWLENMQHKKVEEIGDNNPPVMYGLAQGLKDGAPASVGVCLETKNSQGVSTAQALGMGHVTGIPLACGVKLLAEGAITRKGVLAPEAGHIDPRMFIEDVFEELSKAIDQPLGGFEENVAISRSW